MSGTNTPDPYSRPIPLGLTASNAELFGAAFMQDSGIARGIEEGIESFRRFGALGPTPVAGYHPLDDAALRPFLTEHPDSIGMFNGASSPDHSAMIRDRVLQLKQRETTLALGNAFWTRMAAGMVSPENLATLPFGIGEVSALARGGRVLQTAGRSAALNAGLAAGEWAGEAGQLPGDIAPDFFGDVALAAIFGAALGGLAGAVSGRFIDRAAQQHASVNDAVDGLRTPGVEAETPRVAPRNADAAPELAPAPGRVGTPSESVPLRLIPEVEAEARAIVSTIAGNAARTELGRLPEGVDGMNLGHLVRLAYDLDAADAPRTARHEALHALRSMDLVTAQEWDTLKAAAEREDWIGQTKVAETYADLPAEKQLEEAVAETFARWSQGRADRVEAGEPPPHYGIFQAIKDILTQLRNGLAGRGFQTAEEVFRRIDGGEVGQRPVDSRFLHPDADGLAQARLDWIADTLPEAMASRRAPPAGAAPAAVGPAAAVPPAAESQRLASAFGLEKLITWAGLPWYALKNNPFTGAVGESLARFASELAQDPGLRMRGPNSAASVEALTKQYGVRYAAAVEEMDRLYYQHAGYDPAAATPVRVRVEEARQALPKFGGAPEGKLTMADFDEQVFRTIANGGKHDVPEVAEAARYWTEKFFRPFQKEAAEAGVTLDGAFKAESAAAVQREIDGRKARIEALKRTIDPTYDDPARIAARKARDEAQAFLRETSQAFKADRSDRGLRRQLAEAIRGEQEASAAVEALDEAAPKPDLPGEVMARYQRLLSEEEGRQKDAKKRLAQLADARGNSEPYVFHNWLRGKIAEPGQRDNLVKILERQWEGERPEGSWATARVRAEIAVSHLMRGSVADTLTRALAGHFEWQAMEAGLAAAKAAELAAPVRAMQDAMAPSKLAVELRSMLAWREAQPAVPGLAEAVAAALDAGGLRGATDEAAAKILAEIAGNEGRSAPDDFADAARPGHAKAREIDVPTHLIADYLDSDMKAGAASYARRMGAAIEMSRKTGDASSIGRLAAMEMSLLDEVAAGRGTLAQVDAALQAGRDLRDKVLGTFRVPENPDAYSIRTLRFLTNSAVMAQMGSAIFSNITDLGRVVMAHGIRNVLGGAMDQALNNRAAWQLGGDEAKKAGAALEMTNLGRARELQDLRDVSADASLVEKLAERGAKGMQFVNLVGIWTERMQRFSGALHQSEMIELAVKAGDGSLTPQERLRLHGYGIDDAQAARVVDAWHAAGGDKAGRLYLANTDGWADPDLVRTFRAQLATAVDASVMRPGAADRPNFMSAQLWQTTLLYKSFAMAASQRMVLAGMQQRDGRVLAGMLASVSIAWLIGQARGGAPPESAVNWDRIYGENTKRGREGALLPMESLFTAVEKSGVLGILGDLNNATESLTSNNVGLRPLLGLAPPIFMKDPSWAQRLGAVAGPAVSPLLTATWAFTDPSATGNQAAGAVRRMLPFNNLIWLGGGFRALQREAGGALGADD